MRVEIVAEIASLKDGLLPDRGEAFEKGSESQVLAHLGAALSEKDSSSSCKIPSRDFKDIQARCMALTLASL